MFQDDIQLNIALGMLFVLSLIWFWQSYTTKREIEKDLKMMKLNANKRHKHTQYRVKNE